MDEMDSPMHDAIVRWLMERGLSERTATNAAWAIPVRVIRTMVAEIYLMEHPVIVLECKDE